MSIGFNCCCAPPNPCNCTWPRVLSYAGSVAQAQSAFYFTNSPTAYGPEPVYTLTYGARPAEIPKQLQLVYYSLPGGVTDPYYVTMPDNAWFSPAIPCTCFGNPVNVYFYLWFQSCRANVMVIDAPYTTGATPDATKGAGNNVFSYTLHSCTPFQMGSGPSAPWQVTGTHGTDDIDPAVVGSTFGSYCCPRVGLSGGCTCP